MRTTTVDDAVAHLADVATPTALPFTSVRPVALAVTELAALARQDVRTTAAD